MFKNISRLSRNKVHRKLGSIFSPSRRWIIFWITNVFVSIFVFSLLSGLIFSFPNPSAVTFGQPGHPEIPNVIRSNNKWWFVYTTTERFGLYQIDNAIHYSITWATWVAIGLITFLAFSLFIVSFVQIKTRAWFKNRIFLFLIVVFFIGSILLLTLGLVAKPMTGSEPIQYNGAEGQAKWWSEIYSEGVAVGRIFDNDWHSWLFRHDASDDQGNFSRIYSLSYPAIAILAFTIFIDIIGLLIGGIGILKSVIDFRSWKRYQTAI